MDRNTIIAALFDFDGVIVDSIGISYAINKEWDVNLEYSRWQSWFEGNVYQGIDSYLVKEETQIEFFKKYKVGLNDLLPVDGIGEVRARTIKTSLKRMQEQFVFDNLML